jgi:chromosomal replication initiator protein
MLPERLRSRFEGGLVTDLQPPDYETRLAILKAKAGHEGVDIACDVLELIARQIQQNIRVLEGSLNLVIAYAKLSRHTPTREIATQALKDIVDNKPKLKAVTPALIMEAVAGSFGLTPDDLRGKKRDKETTLARRITMYLIRQESHYSLSQIGRELGNRDAASVTHSCQKISADVENSQYLRRKIEEIQQTIHGNKSN